MSASAEEKTSPLRGKVIVITGGAKGIGAATARLLHQHAAIPVIVSRDTEAVSKLAAELNDSLGIVANATVRADHERVVNEVTHKFGKIDAYINNAGQGIYSSVEQLRDEDLDEMFLINTKSVLYGMQTVVPIFKKQGFGHVINISSVLGRLCLVKERAAYSAAKAAMNALATCYRMEMQVQGFNKIFISIVSPGPVSTSFATNAKYSERAGLNLSQVITRIPGMQTAEEVAAVVVDVLVRPRADVYTREPAQREMVGSWYSAPDVTAVEKLPPFARPSPQSPLVPPPAKNALV